MAPTTARTRDEVRTAVQAATEWLSIAEAADRLALSHWTIRRRIADGSLTARRFGPRLIRVLASDVDALGRIVPTGGGDPIASAADALDHLVERYVAGVVASASPLTEEQHDQLAALLRPIAPAAGDPNAA